MISGDERIKTLSDLLDAKTEIERALERFPLHIKRQSLMEDLYQEMSLEKSSSDMGTCFNILSVSLSDMSERQLQTVRYFPKSYLRSSEWTSITKSRG